FPLALLNLVVNARIHRALVTSSRSSRGTQRGTVRGSIGWLKHRNLASSGQSQIGGLPIGVKLEGSTQNSLSHTRRWRNRDSKPSDAEGHSGRSSAKIADAN